MFTNVNPVFVTVRIFVRYFEKRKKKKKNDKNTNKTELMMWLRAFLCGGAGLSQGTKSRKGQRGGPKGARTVRKRLAATSRGSTSFLLLRPQNQTQERVWAAPTALVQSHGAGGAWRGLRARPGLPPAAWDTPSPAASVPLGVEFQPVTCCNRPVHGKTTPPAGLGWAAAPQILNVQGLRPHPATLTLGTCSRAARTRGQSRGPVRESAAAASRGGGGREGQEGCAEAGVAEL